jgi:tRNA-Thr(GGU) m(6)t(6)A37 methyltransferase TsaA
VTSFEVKAIGRVESPLTALESAPRQADEGAPEAWLVFDSKMLEGLRSLRPGDEVIVITWLDRARRDVLSVQPRRDASRAPEGNFSTRSPHRPNPIGLHRVEITAIEGRRLRVRFRSAGRDADHRRQADTQRRHQPTLTPRRSEAADFVRRDLLGVR